MSKGKKRSGARPGRPQPLRGTNGKRKGARLWYEGGHQVSFPGLLPLTRGEIMSTTHTASERMPHDLSHLAFLTGQISRLITISATPVVAGEPSRLNAVA